MKNHPTIELAIDSNRGIYCAQGFAEYYMSDLRQWKHCEGLKQARDDVLKGPDFEFYDDQWCFILDNAKTHEKHGGYSVYQDGDIWLVNYDKLGNEDTMPDAVSEAYALSLETDSEALANALSNLYHGRSDIPFTEACKRYSEALDQACDKVYDHLPDYIMTDFGFEETPKNDLWDMVLQSNDKLKQLAPYLHQ